MSTSSLICVNPAATCGVSSSINRGANHLAEGDTVESLANRDKIRLLVEEWNTIKAAVEHGVPIPTTQAKTCF
jgi:hypothetical protein